jgi:hypothetical protein
MNTSLRFADIVTRGFSNSAFTSSIVVLEGFLTLATLKCCSLGGH